MRFPLLISKEPASTWIVVSGCYQRGGLCSDLNSVKVGQEAKVPTWSILTRTPPPGTAPPHQRNQLQKNFRYSRLTWCLWICSQTKHSWNSISFILTGYHFLHNISIEFVFALFVNETLTSHSSNSTPRICFSSCSCCSLLLTKTLGKCTNTAYTPILARI